MYDTPLEAKHAACGTTPQPGPPKFWNHVAQQLNPTPSIQSTANRMNPPTQKQTNPKNVARVNPSAPPPSDEPWPIRNLSVQWHRTGPNHSQVAGFSWNPNPQSLQAVASATRHPMCLSAPYIHTYVHTYVHTYICTYMYLNIFVYTYKDYGHMQKSTFTDTHTHTHMYVCITICVCVYRYTHLHRFVHLFRSLCVSYAGVLSLSLSAAGARHVCTDR